MGLSRNATPGAFERGFVGRRSTSHGYLVLQHERTTAVDGRRHRRQAARLVGIVVPPSSWQSPWSA